MNFVEVMGIVGVDPEERTTPSGMKVVNFRIADNIRRGDSEETIWWRVTIWGNQFDRMLPYIKKGSALVVYGEIRKKPDVYQDRDGNSQVSMEITANQIKFSPFGRSNREEGSEQGAYAQSSQGSNPSGNPSGGYGGGGYQQAHSNPYSHGAGGNPGNSPGGFRPAVGASTGDDFSEDNLPF